MKEYHKINTVYKRDPNSKHKTLLEGEFSLPEFEYLKDVNWICTEKIDGTNIRVMWDGEKVRFGGKTDNAQIPTLLLSTLQDTFPVERLKEVFPDSNEVCLYGEGFGKGIQKGGNYLSDATGFILFDVKIGDWWLQRTDVEDIGANLNLWIVPVIGVMPLLKAVDKVREGFKSTIAENKDYIAEGLIMKPAIELFTRSGQRIVSKIKYKDFER